MILTWKTRNNQPEERSSSAKTWAGFPQHLRGFKDKLGLQSSSLTAPQSSGIKQENPRANCSYPIPAGGAASPPPLPQELLRLPCPSSARGSPALAQGSSQLSPTLPIPCANGAPRGCLRGNEGKGRCWNVQPKCRIAAGNCSDKLSSLISPCFPGYPIPWFRTSPTATSLPITQIPSEAFCSHSILLRWELMLPFLPSLPDPGNSQIN